MYKGNLEDVEKTRISILKAMAESKKHISRIRSVMPLVYSERNNVVREYESFPLTGFSDGVVYPFDGLGHCWRRLAEKEPETKRGMKYMVRSKIAEDLFEEGISMRNMFGTPLPKDIHNAMVEMETVLTETELYIEKAQIFLDKICEDT